jgi:hypothetical protein
LSREPLKETRNFPGNHWRRLEIVQGTTGGDYKLSREPLEETRNCPGNHWRRLEISSELLGLTPSYCSLGLYPILRILFKQFLVWSLVCYTIFEEDQREHIFYQLSLLRV